jgi:hypothetical protein
MYILTKAEKRVLESLPNFQTEDGRNMIGKKKYDLRVMGKTVCPRSFSRLYNISYNILLELGKDLTLPPRVSLHVIIPFLLFRPLQKEKEAEKKSRVIAFLQYLVEHYSEPMVSYPDSYRRYYIIWEA